MPRIIIISLIAGLIGALAASAKDRSAVGWFLICFVVPLAVIILLFLPRKQAAERRTKQCPFCAAVIDDAAQVCSRCSRTQPVNIAMVKCPSCGVIVEDGARCGSCGGALR